MAYYRYFGASLVYNHPMTENRHSHPTEPILEPTVIKRHRRKKRLLEFTHSSTRSTIIMVSAAFLAIILENIPGLPSLYTFWHGFNVGIEAGLFRLNMSIGHLINDFLMAFFFLVVGLEIKYEMTAGELRNPRKVALPIIAAAGGAILPALVYLVFNIGTGFEGGWGVPTANDIAFTLGILALLGSRIPVGLRAFLATATIADDIFAIGIIAIFYSNELDVLWLIGGIASFGLLIVLNRRHVYDLAPYILVGLVMWCCFLFSGVHATLAGVLLALAVPAKSEIQLKKASAWFEGKAKNAADYYDPGQPDIAQKEYLQEVRQINRVSRMTIPPLTRLEARLHVPVFFIIMPLFAFANAAIPIIGVDPMSIVTNSVALGVFFGLLIGKPVGIFFASWLTIKSKLSDLPLGVGWGQMLGVSILGGVGFTMVIFIANLAFADAAIVSYAKTAIIAASLITGLVGFFILRWATDKATDLDDEGEDMQKAEEGSKVHVVILTGGLASGKDTVSAILAAYGATVLDLDIIAREEQQNEKILSELRKEFGDDIIDESGTLRRRLLAERAFISKESLDRLNAICWPPMFRKLTALVDSYKDKPLPDARLLVVQIPILVEALAEGYELLGLADEVISVVSDEEKRLARAVRRGMDPQDAERRIMLQAHNADRIALSDTVFINNSTIDDLRDQVISWYENRAGAGLF